MAKPRVLYYLNDNLIQITGLQNKSSSAYLNSATVTAKIMGPGGSTALVAGSSSITMSYSTGSNGNYEGTSPDTTSVVLNKFYSAVITANAGAGLQGRWKIPLHVVDRTT